MNKKLFNLIWYVGITILAILFLVCFIPSAKKIYNERFFKKIDVNYTYEVKVKEIVDEYEEVDSFDEECECYLYLCEVINGPESDIGDEILVIQRIEKINKYKYIKATIGNKIFVSKASEWTNSGKYAVDWEFTGNSTSFDRISALIILVILFAILIIAFSRLQGINTLIALGLSLICIFMVFIPKILLGGNVYFWTFVTFTYVVIVTLALVIGFNEKSIVALVGCLGGILVIGILTVIVQKVFSLTGNYDETTNELYILTLDAYNVKLDMRALIFSIITLGSMGALLDVAISLSSSLYEVSLKGASTKEIIKSGFTIGKDMLGTMTNTLILAYLGTSLAIILYDILYWTLEGIFRLETIIIEIIQSLVGTIGMLSAIPITSIFSGYLYKSKLFTKRKIPSDMSSDEINVSGNEENNIQNNINLQNEAKD